MANNGFVPIIEPVRSNLAGLRRAINAIRDANGEGIVVVNPRLGELSNNGGPISTLLETDYLEEVGLSAGVFLDANMSSDRAIQLALDHNTRPLAFIHDGFQHPIQLLQGITDNNINAIHVFFASTCGQLYRDRFDKSTRVLIRDGFQNRRNRDHPPLERFSDLHLVYQNYGMDGFGDFLTVGNNYSESGGPAYAVAIHVTFINSDDEDVMYIHHFLSDRQDDASDTPGKFSEALEKLIEALDEDGSLILETDAMNEFRSLSENDEYPGLGKVKELSMRHHIETFADYFS